MYNTKEDQIRRDRCNYGYTMATLVFNTFRRYPRFIDNEEEFRYLEEAEKAAKKISNALETLSEEEIDMYLSGEHALHYLGPDNDLRAKLVTLNHSEKFDSEKHISPEAWKGMASCRGSFRSAVEEKEGLKHFVIRYTITSDDGVWRNGDYYYDNVYTSHYNHILYQEDIEEIYKRKLQREKQESDEYYVHFTKYFKNGVIPSEYKGFEEYLIDQTIDERIIKELGTFVLMYNSPDHQRSHTDFAHSNTHHSILKTYNVLKD